jgi:hypothetical protein
MALDAKKESKDNEPCASVAEAADRDAIVDMLLEG